MEHIGIDLGTKQSQICIRSEDESILEERTCLTTRLGSFMNRRPRSRVILETCAEAFAVADAALAANHEVRVVPATLVRSLGVGKRGIKTDVRDARLLSEVSCRIDLPSVHIPSSMSRELKAISGLRESMVASRTQLVNAARGQMRTKLRLFKRGGVETFPQRVRAMFAEDKLEVPTHLARVLASIEQLTVQIEDANAELERLAAGNEICRRLMTAPGIGPLTSVRFLAAVDQVGRFPNAHRLESYLGLTPGERSSSQHTRRTGITKAGSPATRWLLSQACWSAWRIKHDDPLVQWAKQVAERRGRAIAITAMCRKLAGVLYAMWRDGTAYDPKRLQIDASPAVKVYHLKPPTAPELPTQGS